MTTGGTDIPGAVGGVTTIRKEIRSGIEAESQARAKAHAAVGNTEESAQKRAELLAQLETDMLNAAAELDFERAAKMRDQIANLRDEASPKRTENQTVRQLKTEGVVSPRLAESSETNSYPS